MRFRYFVAISIATLPLLSAAQVNRVQQARQTVQQANQAAVRRQAPVAQPQQYRAPATYRAAATSTTQMMGATYPYPARDLAQGAAFTGGNAHTSNARSTAATASASSLFQAIHMFYLDTGRLPKTNEGLNVLLQAPPGVRNWNGPYVTRVSWKETFTDPWGNAYRYINTTRTGAHPSFSIRSNGPDGMPNTSDDLGMDG